VRTEGQNDRTTERQQASQYIPRSLCSLGGYKYYKYATNQEQIELDGLRWIWRFTAIYARRARAAPLRVTLNREGQAIRRRHRSDSGELRWAMHGGRLYVAVLADNNCYSSIVFSFISSSKKRHFTPRLYDVTKRRNTREPVLSSQAGKTWVCTSDRLLRFSSSCCCFTS